jgi:ribosome-associated protein
MDAHIVGDGGGELTPRRSSSMGRVSPLELARTAANLALDKKAEDVVVLDLSRFSLDCDYFLIASGTSDPHVRAIAEWVEEEIHARCGELPWHREGMAAARWVLLDYVDVVVHVFLVDVRQTYMLERLWGDAPVERFGPDDAGAASAPPARPDGETAGTGGGA